MSRETDSTDDEANLSPESLYSLRLREWSLQIPLIRLSADWERSILDLIPIHLRQRHPRRVEKTLMEIRDIYESDMRNCAIRSIIPVGESTTAEETKEFGLRARERAEDGCSVPRLRFMFAKKYFLSHPIMKHIIEAAIKLPRLIVDVREFRGDSFFEISELHEALTCSIDRAAAVIRKDYYGEIVKSISRHLRRYERNSRSVRAVRLMDCAKNLFAQQILRIMMSTIDELTAALADYRHRCPQLNVRLVWIDGRISTEPTVHQVYSLWHNLVDSIERIAENLPTFERADLNSGMVGKVETDETKVQQDDYLKVTLPDWYLSRSHSKVDSALALAVGPFEKYFEKILQTFGEVSSPETMQNIQELVSKGRHFDVYCSHAKDLSLHYDRANDLIDNLYYDIGRLNQTSARIRLRSHIAEMRGMLTKKLLLHHREYNEEICREFLGLEREMLEIPRNARALFELSESISRASRILVDTLERRVKKSIEMLSSLLELTIDMSESHMSLNSRTINWLAEIQPIFTRSNTLCEAMKSELEDELQRRINNLNVDIDAVIPKFVILDDMDDASRVEEYAEHLAILVGHIDELDSQIQQINFEERLFKFPETSFPNVDEIREILTPVNRLNSLTCDWRRDHAVWLDGPFEYIDAQEVRRKTLDYRERFEKLNSSLRAKIKLDIQSSASKPFRYSGVVDDPDPMQQSAPLKLCWQVLEDVESFERHLELVECVCNPALRERHWDEMAMIREQGGGDPDSLRFTPNAGTTLRKLIALDLQKDIEKYQVVSIGANKELALARRLQDMVDQWDTVDFSIVAEESKLGSPALEKILMKKKTFVHLDDIEILMEEHRIVVAEMKVSYFVKPVESSLMELSSSLRNVGDTMQRFLGLQDEWFDLETVFRDGDTDRTWEHEKLGKASVIFFGVHSALREVNEEIMAEPKFQSISGKSEKLLHILGSAAEELELVKETVRNYIQEVRLLFPRFYFLSDREVVRIVFEPAFSVKMKLLVNKCFSDIRSLRIARTANGCARVVATIDSHDQELRLKTTTREVSGQIQDFRIQDPVCSFVSTEKAIISAVRESILQCSINLTESCDPPSLISRHKELLLCDDTPGMSSLCASRIYWTCRIEEAFETPQSRRTLMSSLQEELACKLKSLIADLRLKMSRKQRKKLVALIIQTRDQEDITKLVSSTARSSQDFYWKAQIRHYWLENDVKIVILDTVSKYGYEYTACEKPQVITPLTDRCHRSVMEAHRNGLCGVLFGPTGASKTRCIQDLARTLATRFYIYNCHENILNYSHIENIFRGLTGCSPCWLFFKHLDLLNVQMQSTIAQQIALVSRNFLGFNGPELNFRGANGNFRDHGTFVTGTISTKYSRKFNRQGLTDSLKILFRPVAMTHPDTRRIIEVELFAEGFVDAAQLAGKIRLVEKYSRDQMSSRFSFCDFSIRSTKSVVHTACALKNRYPEEDEDALILRALVDVHLPKFHRSADMAIFQQIIENIFPGVALPSPDYSTLLSGLKEIRRVECPTDVTENRLYSLKIIQLFEMLFFRHSIVVVGPQLSGKTSVIENLGKTLSLLNRKSVHSSSESEKPDVFPAVESVRLNHTALALEEIFGWYQDDSGQAKLSWKDGILTRTLRSFADKKPKQKFQMQWLILDGSLDDSIFLEKLGTLLDDNKTLFLPSSERIPLNDSTSIIIETTSLKKASPATVSRCGVIHVDESTIGWRGLSRRWISELRSRLPVRSDDERDYRVDYVKFLESVIEWAIDGTLDFAWSRLSARVRPLTNRSHLVTSVLRILEMHLTDAIFDTGESSSEAKSNFVPPEAPKWTVGNLFLWTQAALLMALIWGLGGVLDREARAALDEFCTTTWKTGGCNTKIPRPEILKTYELFLPPQGMIQDHVYVFSGTGNWRHWSDVLKKGNGVSNGSEKSSRNREASQTSYVATIDSIKYMNLFETHVKHRKPFILLGEMATGKTLYMRHLLRSKICQSTCSSNFLSLGFAGPGYKSSQAQRMFLAKMSKVKRGVYGAGSSRLCVNFIDDLNIVLSSKGQGDEAALELVRQYHDGSQWFDTETGERITLLDVMFLGAITLDCSNEWNDKWREPRFFRHFSLYDVERPSNESIFRIYSNVLFSNLRANQFNADVTGSVNSMVNATVDLYTSLRQTLRPVPSKFQYRFTLRDVGRVVTGCSFVHKESVETKVTFLRLWVHEALRVFADRIVDLEDSEFVFLKIREAVGSHFKDSFEAAFDHLKNDSDQLTRENFQHLIFSDFMQLDGDAETVQTQLNGTNGTNGINGTSNRRRYDEVAGSREALRTKAMSYLARYNESVSEARKKLDVHMLPGMLEHLIRICRVLSIPGGSLLMICFGGSGRRSLTTLASHLKGHVLHELSRPVPSSSGKPWRRDLKRACMSCTAGPGQTRATDCTFFITDRQITESPPSLLRDVCSLMKTGQVPELFSTDERELIVERSRLHAQNGDRNLEMCSHDVIDYFYDRCQEKLHFVLYFERAFGRTRSGHFRPSYRDSIFNSIVSHCSVDCYENWPDESFTEIARTFMKDLSITPDLRSRAIEASKYFYDSVDSWRGKQSSDRDFPDNKRGSKLPVAAYLHMVKLYGLLIAKRQSEIRAARKRYLGGLEKLQLAGEEVKEMKSILTRLRPQLEQSAEETAATMRKIERENVSVENATIQVKREEEVANGIAKVAGILKEECEADLAVAIPILEDAIAALNTLKPTDITLVKAMKNPPDTVKLVLAAVCVMLNVPPDRSVDPVTGKKSIDYWAPSKRILGDMNFLQSLKDYDKDNIPASVMVIINKTYMNDDTFQPHIVAKASSAAEGLCKWVRAMVSYDEVAKVVAPKKEKLGGAERECNASLEYLNQKRKSLAALNDKLAALNATLEATLAKKLQLEKQVENCTAKLAKAEGLITSLAGEKDKWLRSAETLTKSYDCLAGDILLSCGVIALLGTFDAVHREMHIEDWLSQLRRLEVPTSGSSYDFVGSLETESEVNNWKQAGLSNNSFSQGNAAIMKNSLLWPVFLDPENQANSWIRRLEAGNRIIVVKATDPDWLEDIERCVDLDRPVLVENLERSRYFESTVLDYILARLCPSANCRSSGPERCRSTETTASWSPQPGIRPRNFRFYVTISVSLHEAALESHVYKRMSVVNFALADEALEDRLLDIVVSREEPELQDTFDRITSASASNVRALKDEEDKILAILSGTSSGNIVEDERAIEALDCSRNLSLEIKRREEAARETAKTMNEFRATYRPLVKYCASLYNTVAGIANLSHMYRFSLDWFTRLYVRSIDESMKSVVRKKRLRYLRRSFTEILHSSVRNGLLGPHKLVYSFLLAIKILLDSKRVSQDELRFLRDSGSQRLRQISRNSGDVSSSLDSRLAAVEDLSRILPSVFQDLPTSFRENPAVWEIYCDRGEETSTLPAPWNELSEFQRLILAISLRPGRSLATITCLVENTLETSLTSLAPYSVARCFEESSCLIPLIFILPSYLEASGIVAKWARIAGYASKVSRFDVGAVDDKATDRSIDEAIARRREQGGWILLENCHLATDQWLAKLEKICESLDPSNTVLGFRLWLTSYPSHRFPIRILQNSVKIHWEGPEDGIKESLLRSYQSEPLDEPDFYDACPGKNRAFAKLIYGLCFFHGVARGRCKFDKRAWNVRYEFADCDLKMSIGQLQNFLNKSSGDEVPEDFQTLEYLVGECYYGGRILDPVDGLRLKTLLRVYCNPEIVRATSSYILVNSEDTCQLRYAIPNRSEYNDFVKHIKNFVPGGETRPEVFGLDENSSVVRDARNTDEFARALGVLLADNILANDCDYYAATTRDFSRPSSCTNIVCYFKMEEQGGIEKNLRTILRGIREKLQLHQCDEEISLDITNSEYSKKYFSEEPLMVRLLIEEVELYNELVAMVQDSLIDVERTYNEGLAPLFSTSMATDELARDLLESRVPWTWMNLGSEDVASQREQRLPQFVDHLARRRSFLKSWTAAGRRGSFWLGGIVRRRKFVSATRLTMARRCGTDVGELDVGYEVLKMTVDESGSWEFVDVDDLEKTHTAASSSSDVDLRNDTKIQEASVHIHGLFLSGARWDGERSTLVENFPKCYWHAMPVIRFGSRFGKNNAKQRDSSSYLCPVYATYSSTIRRDFFYSVSNDYVTNVPLASKDASDDHWIKRAVTLYCNKDE